MELGESDSQRFAMQKSSTYSVKVLQVSSLALQEVYQQLMSNAQERGDVRRQLLQTQAELAQARSELSSWT